MDAVSSAGGPRGGRPRHPYALWSFTLGILGLVPCLAPLALGAWLWGNRALAAIDAGAGRWSGRGTAVAGRRMGIVGSALLVLWACLAAYASLAVR